MIASLSLQDGQCLTDFRLGSDQKLDIEPAPSLNVAMLQVAAQLPGLFTGTSLGQQDWLQPVEQADKC